MKVNLISFSAPILALFLTVTLGTACGHSFQTRQDFDEALLRAQNSPEEAESVPQEILEALSFVPEKLRKTAVDTVATLDAEQSTTSEPVLREMLNHDGMQDPKLQQYLVEQIITRDNEGAPDAIHAKVKENDELLTEEVIGYFGEKKYENAVPEISKQIDQSKNVSAGVKALLDIEGEKAHDYLISLPKKSKHPALTNGIKSFPGIKDTSRESSKREVLEALLSNEKDYDEAVLLLTIGTLDRMNPDYVESSYKVLSHLYDTSKNEKVRDAAIHSMARMKGTTPYFMARDFANFSLIQAQAYFVLWDLDPDNALGASEEEGGSLKTTPEESVVQKSQPTKRAVSQQPVKKKKAVAKKKAVKKKKVAKKKAAKKKKAASRKKKVASKINASNKYRERLYRVLAASFPENEASSLLKRMSNALYAYSSSNSTSAEFIIRSYVRYFGDDRAGAQVRLANGLRQKNSLRAILKNVIVEYKGDRMRRYAVANLFAIPRWQATVLLDLYREKSL